ncbi:MAG: hypothetical protein ACYC4D_02015 [Thermoleophilia bacterium]
MNDKQANKPEPCRLHQAQNLEEWCSRDNCIYWRLLETQDLDVSNKEGCGLQFYQIVDSLTPEMGEWLLKMKKRLENTTPEAGKSRITFKRREQE